MVAARDMSPKACIAFALACGALAVGAMLASSSLDFAGSGAEPEAAESGAAAPLAEPLPTEQGNAAPSFTDASAVEEVKEPEQADPGAGGSDREREPEVPEEPAARDFVSAADSAALGGFLPPGAAGELADVLSDYLVSKGVAADGGSASVDPASVVRSGSVTSFSARVGCADGREIGLEIDYHADLDLFGIGME